MIIASSTSGISDEIVKYIGKLLLYAERNRRIEWISNRAIFKSFETSICSDNWTWKNLFIIRLDLKCLNGQVIYWKISNKSEERERKKWPLLKDDRCVAYTIREISPLSHEIGRCKTRVYQQW